MFKATRLIKEALEAKGFPMDAVNIRESDERSSLIIPVPVEGAQTQRIHFINTDNDNDVAISVYEIVSKVPDSKRAAMLEAINECNNQYRFLKFVLDKDGDVNVEYDCSDEVCDSCIGQAALDIGIIRIHSILEDTYPILMKAMWS